MNPSHDLSFAHLFVPGTSGRTLLLLHGTGGDESDLLPVGRSIAPDAARLGVRGRVSEHGAPRFFRRLAEGVFDLPDLHAQTAALAAFVGEAADAYGFDPARVVAVGFSNGANIAASLLLTRPGVLAGAVLLRPMVPFEPAEPPRLDGVPVLVSRGLNDPMVPRQQTDRLAEILRGGGAEVTVAEQPAGHGLVPDDVAAAARWFAAIYG